MAIPAGDDQQQHQPQGPASEQQQPQVAASGQQPQSAPQRVAPDPAATDVIKRCTAVVEDYRHGKISKAVASHRCLVAITKAGFSGDSFGPYLEQLDEHDREKELAAASATQPPPATTNSGSGGIVPPAAAVPPRKRARSPDDDDSDSDADAGDDVGAHVVKRRYDPSRAGFAAAPSFNFLPPHIRTTLQLRDNYLGDLKAATRHLRRDGRAPPFPATLWPIVLADEFLDFDKLVTRRFSRFGTDDTSHDLGNGVSIKLPSARAARTVADEGDWDHCFTKYKACVAHAYPHRLAELESYGSYVRSIFRSTYKLEHHRVISADAAVRAEIANDDSLSFFETVKLRPIFDRWLSPYGAEALSSRLAPSASDVTAHSAPSSGASFPRSVDARRLQMSGQICDKFNDGKCTHHFCRHSHVCNLCGSNLHARTGHPADPAGDLSSSRT